MRDFIREHVIERAIALGCDYIQMDAPNYGQSYTDPEVMAAMRRRRPRPRCGADWRRRDRQLASSRASAASRAPSTSVAATAPAAAGPPPAATTSSRPHAFPRLTNYDTLLLEYDTPRAGDFSPLQHVLPSTTVVLGLLTTKDGKLEDAAQIEAAHPRGREVPAAGAPGAEHAVRLRLRRRRQPASPSSSSRPSCAAS